MRKPAGYFAVCTKAALLFAALLFTMIPDLARGHVFPDHAEPKVGSTVSSSPLQVRIWFDGDLEPAFCSIMVHAGDGSMVDKRDGRVDPSDSTLLEVSLPTLPAGAYRVLWSVVARDGHRTTGDYTFTIK